MTSHNTKFIVSPSEEQDGLVTQELLRDLKALYQEPEIKTKYMFLIMYHITLP
jgi:hypothetical protein